MTVKSDKRCILTDQHRPWKEENVDKKSASTATSSHSNEPTKKVVTGDEDHTFKSIAETPWNSIYIASALSFVGSAQFSLYFSSLWPYLQIVSLVFLFRSNDVFRNHRNFQISTNKKIQIDRSISEKFFGYIIAIYSFGQILSAPSFGFWSNRIKQVRLPLLVGLVLMFFGNAFYIALAVKSFPIRTLLLIGRLITGMGSGNVCLLRTYASTASSLKDRPRAIAYVTCGQAVGNTFGPALQLLFTTFSYPGIQLIGDFRLNLYTAPAYLACTMNLFGAIALLFFKEHYAGLIEPENAEVNEVTKVQLNGSKKIHFIDRFTKIKANFHRMIYLRYSSATPPDSLRCSSTQILRRKLFLAFFFFCIILLLRL